MSKPTPLNVGIGIPFYGSVEWAFSEGIMALYKSPPCPMRIMTVGGDSLVTRARNTITSNFIHQAELTHLFFIDSDIAFTRPQVERILYWASQGHPIVCGLYPKKQPNLEWVLNTIPDKEYKHQGLEQVMYAGTGFMCIAREVFQRFIAEGLADPYTPDKDHDKTRHWDFWKVGVTDCTMIKKKRYLSEDWWFCEMAWRLGIPVAADYDVQLQHIGRAVYPIKELTDKLYEKRDVNLKEPPKNQDQDGNITPTAPAHSDGAAEQEPPAGAGAP